MDLPLVRIKQELDLLSHSEKVTAALVVDSLVTSYRGDRMNEAGLNCLLGISISMAKLEAELKR